MFVDDDVDSLELFKRCVEIFGHQAITATSPKQALEFAENLELDVVFVDLYLSESSGLEVVSRLRMLNKTSKIPVYVLSAGSEYELDDTIERSGANAYLQKPVHLQNLLATISRAISNQGQSVSLSSVQ